jgi:hypothetical protein
VIRLTLAAARWTGSEDVYRALLTALGAPSWHGHNLDALDESLRSTNLNRVIPPFVVEVQGLSVAAPEAQRTARQIAALIKDLQSDGVAVSWREVDADLSPAALRAVAYFRSLSAQTASPEGELPAPYPKLAHFLGAYFHQDWMLDAPTWQSTVDRYLRQEPRHWAEAATTELEHLLEIEKDEAVISAILRDLRCNFRSSGHGTDSRQWLVDLHRYLMTLPRSSGQRN